VSVKLREDFHGELNTLSCPGLAMGPSLAALALSANWNYFEISLVGAVCALLAALCSAYALRDVQHAGAGAT